jgi:predicted molibdopterin-dependent oxidoreductase YjgC
MECVVVHDLFLNETANYAHVFLPGSTFLEKDGTFTNAERRIQRVRKVMEPMNGYEDWQVTQLLANALGLGWTYTHPSQIMDEIAAVTPTFSGVSFEKLDALGSIQWPCNDKAPEGTPIMHMEHFVRGKGKFVRTEYIPTDERTGPRYPLLLTTGRILSQYNVGAQTRRTDNVIWHEEDLLEIHPHDAEQRGIRDGDWVKLASRAGETTLRATITDRVAPGVVYTTFHHPLTQANVVTTEFSDWATNCPEYKVTAVEVSPSNERLAGALRGAGRAQPPYRAGGRGMSSHSIAKLVYMANQIAREFAAQHPDEAAQATYDHLWHFWDPRMRQLIVEHLDAGGEGLNEVARLAVEKLKTAPRPQPVTRATEFNKAADHTAGRNLMSDAG